MPRTSSKLERPGFARRRSSTTRRRESAGNATPLCRAPRELKSVKNVFRMNRNKKRNNKNIVEESRDFHLLSERSKNSLSRQRQRKLIVYPGKQDTLIKDFLFIHIFSYPQQKDSRNFGVIPET